LTSTIEFPIREQLHRLQKEAHQLEARIAKEKQFNRKVDLNRQLRDLRSDTEAILEPFK